MLLSLSYNNIYNKENQENFNILVSKYLFKNKEITEQNYYLKDFLPIPQGYLSMIYGAGGVGKSLLALRLVVQYILEAGEYGFYWNSELTISILYKRLEKILRILSAEDKKDYILDRLLISTETNTTKLKQVLAELKIIDVKFIILDPLISFFNGSNENDNVQARKFMQEFTSFAQSQQAAVIVVHHQKKMETNNTNICAGASIEEMVARGASAFVDAVSTVYLVADMKTKTEKGRKRIKMTKDNLGIQEFWKETEYIFVLPTEIQEVEIRNTLF